MLCPTEARADAPKVAVSPTSASPMTSADAVMAVRRGLRIALARASTPGGPKRRSGAPSACTAGRTTAGSRNTTPTSTANAPSATTCTWSRIPLTSRARASPYTRSAPPPTSTSPPSTRRRPKPPTARSGMSAIAATGGTRAARTAGIAAATTVTRTPTTSDTTIVRPSTTVVVAGRSRPSSRSRSSRPWPSRIPIPSPITDATDAHDERLEHDGPHHLTAGRAHGAQETELAGALRDEDREGVEDDEGTHHHADGREAEQRVGEEPEELAHRLAHLERRLRSRLHLVGRPERVLDPMLQLLGGDVDVALHVDRVDRCPGVELLLRRLEVERRRRDRPDVLRGTEAEDPDDLVLLRRAAQQDPHAVADAVAVLARGLRVHRHLPRTARGVTTGELQGAVDPGDPERGGTATADGVAVPVDELCQRGLHEPLCRCGPRSRQPPGRSPRRGSAPAWCCPRAPTPLRPGGRRRSGSGRTQSRRTASPNRSGRRWR